MPSDAKKDAMTLAEASRIRDDDGRRKAARELSRSKKKERVSEMESGSVALSNKELRKQWTNERIEGETDLQWDEWLANRKKGNS